MTSIDKIIDIESRIEHLETVALWIAKETVHTDNAISQTGTLISVLADELRERVFTLVKELEEKVQSVEKYIQ